jgi:CheY-like chemotaxis protein
MKKVLIVDADAVTRLSIAQTLLRDGFDVMFASDGIKALELTRKTKPDLIICALEIPELDGHELEKAVHENRQTKHIPVVLVTESAPPSGPRGSADPGPIGFLHKPFTRDQLIMTVQKSLSRRSLIPP